MILRVSPLTPINDQGRISPHIIKQTSDEVTEIKILWWTVRRITNKKLRSWE